MSLLEYKGYRGTIETEDDILFGHVLGLKNTIIMYIKYWIFVFYAIYFK